jgi:hypothetical protein
MCFLNTESISAFVGFFLVNWDRNARCNSENTELRVTDSQDTE